MKDRGKKEAAAGIGGIAVLGLLAFGLSRAAAAEEAPVLGLKKEEEELPVEQQVIEESPEGSGIIATTTTPELEQRGLEAVTVVDSQGLHTEIVESYLAPVAKARAASNSGYTEAAKTVTSGTFVAHTRDKGYHVIAERGEARIGL